VIIDASTAILVLKELNGRKNYLLEASEIAKIDRFIFFSLMTLKISNCPSNAIKK